MDGPMDSRWIGEDLADQRGSVLNAHFLEDVMKIAFEGPLADKKYFGQVFIGSTSAEKLYHVHLPFMQAKPLSQGSCMDRPLGSLSFDDEALLEAQGPFFDCEINRFSEFPGVIFRSLKIIT